MPEGGGVVDVHVVPLLTSTLPAVPGATVWNALVPFPSNTALAENVVPPVPPLATGSVPVTCVLRSTPESVPPSVREPLEVTVPVRVMPLTVPVPDTLVTVPPPVAATVKFG